MSPWHITKGADCPTSKPFAVVQDATGEIEGCHKTKVDAEKQLAALYTGEKGGRAVGAKYKVVEKAPGCPEAKPWGVVGEDGKRLEDCACHETEDGAKSHMAVYFAGRASAPRSERRRPEIRGHELGALPLREFRIAGDASKREAEVVVCTYGSVDDYGTIWRPGCWRSSLERKKPKVVWAHDWTDIIGQVVDYTDSDTELRLLLRFSDFEAVSRARQAWTQLRDGDVDEFSFSFDRRDWTPVGDLPKDEQASLPFGAKELMNEADMIEASPVLVGAVQGTRPVAVRSPRAGVVPAEFARDLALRLQHGDLDITEALVELKGAVLLEDPQPSSEPPAESETPEPETEEPSEEPPPPEDPREPEQPSAEDQALELAQAELEAVEAEALVAAGLVGRARTPKVEIQHGAWIDPRDGRLWNPPERRAAIAAHDTPVRDDAWDGPAAVAAMPNDAATLAYCAGWRDPDGDPDAKSTYKLWHHRTKGGPAIGNGIRNALARLPQANIPAGDRSGVERHLRKHLDKLTGNK